MKVNSNMASNLFLLIIFLIIIYQTLADTATDIGDAASNVTFANATDDVNSGGEVFPLTSFFKKKGIVLLALMAGIVIVLVKSLLPSGK